MATTTEATAFRIWPGAAPGSEDWDWPEQETLSEPPNSIRMLRNITQPTLTPFLPDPAVATGTAVVVCPGGGHRILAIDHEGLDVARWLVTRGIAAFVLRYRLMRTPASDDEFLHPAPDGDRDAERARMRAQGALGIADGSQALRVVRERAAEWSLDPARVGILGFSAGGHVAAGAALSYDAASRPSFTAPIYGALWEDVQVPSDAPPLFTALATDDSIAVTPCLQLYSAWHAAGIPAEIHIYAAGGHGFGMFRQGLPSDSWIERFGEWLAAIGMTGAAGVRER